MTNQIEVGGVGRCSSVGRKGINTAEVRSLKLLPAIPTGYLSDLHKRKHCNKSLIVIIIIIIFHWENGCLDQNQSCCYDLYIYHDTFEIDLI